MTHSASPKSAAVWRHHIDRQVTGNLNPAAYCRKTKLNLGTFRWWRSRLNHRSPTGKAPGFVMLPQVSVAATPLDGVTIMLPGNIRLIAYPQTERQLLADTVRLLRTAP